MQPKNTIFPKRCLFFVGVRIRVTRIVRFLICVTFIVTCFLYDWLLLLFRRWRASVLQRVHLACKGIYHMLAPYNK
jgi:hypothetical protein